MILDNSRRNLLKTGFLLVFFLAVVFFMRLFVITPYVVDMSSMYPTLRNADIMLVNRLSYVGEGPNRGDIIVFDPPSSTGEYVKRIIGLPGEYIDYYDGKFYINGNLFIEEEDRTKTDYGKPMPVRENSERLILKLGDDEYYVVGDNRQSSLDSRSFGPIKRSTIIGRAFLTVWPIGRFQVLQ
jgi:signal peptidase I